ncbi:uncharacterized protein LOC126972576 [Leptidea sinapis]|uniref:Uncharacterized protein n=1 Tax=Leptidea sinapis TaxID=189913 RepID=A0A5E4Q312_9NEOP|nr:uncharacterized protein LOC126972576 [Leptidea sinapis]VVC91493.1 unnamed protein product [Leptidea sinapis]
MIHKWWYVFIRKRTKPIPEDTAVVWKKRLSIAYGLLTWNAFGLMIYSISQGKADWAHYYGLKSDEEKAISPAKSWTQILGIKNAKVYRISGLTKTDEYEIIDGEEVRKPDIKETEELLD